MAGIAIAHHDRRSRTSRRVDYVVAAAVNLGILWVAQHLLEWGWPAFLTDSFDELLPIVTLSLAASVVVNLLWAWRDPAWFRHVGQIGLNLIGLAVAVRTWQVYPFDFTDYAGVWEPFTKVLIVLSIVGMAVATAVELVRLVIDAGTDEEPRRAPEAGPTRHHPTAIG